MRGLHACSDRELPVPEVESRVNGDAREPIFIFPALAWTRLNKSTDPRPFPLSAANASLWYNARAALWNGLQRLRLRPGDRILVPAYACGSEIDVLLEYGLILDWYTITAELAPDLERLERLESLYPQRAAALFVIHYFGFPQPLDEILAFTRRHQMLLIEDTAHGLCSKDSSGRPLGSRGDMSVFSLYKTLPLADGGALLTNARDPAQSSAPRHPAWRPTIGQLRLLLQRTVGQDYPRLGKLLATRLPRPWRRLAARAADTAATSSSGVANPVFERARLDWQMSDVSTWLLRRVGTHNISALRRANYRRLAEQLPSGPHLRPLFAHLPEGTCPLMFPVLEGVETSGLRSWLRRHAIECHGFGFEHDLIPTEGFGWEATLKARVVCLPVHQDLTPVQIDFMAATINQWSAQQR